VEVVMEMQNITLSVPKEILYKAKRVALDKRTSLSGLLTQALTEIVESAETYDVARHRQTALLERGLDLGTRGTIGWAREDLHAR
jgi:hypothetical protein